MDKWYVEQVLAAGCAFVNCIPVFICSQPYWAGRFAERRLPLIGDDIKSQVGSTIVHRVLTALFRERGVRLDRTYQLNFGGNMDFYNMLERERLESKKISKTGAVTSQLDYALPSEAIHVGPSDYGLGQPEQRERGDRRGALRQAGARPRDRWSAGGAGGLPDEDAPEAVHRRPGAPAA